MKRRVLLVVCLATACAPTRPQQPLLGSAVAVVDNGRLVLFGGPRLRKYLGCLTCPEHEADSIWNRYGTFGAPQGIDSIWNRRGQFGSPYSPYSPWNRQAADPPVVLDLTGASRGRFTVARTHPHRTADPAILKILEQYEHIAGR